MSNKTVVVGMSGGVDSSVAALLLINQGYNVIGLFMNNWEESDDGICHSADDYADAKSVCNKLKIPCYSVNLSKEYYNQVFTHFLDEYKKGRTPNPDVLCNREIKFSAFKQHAFRLGADYIATGHYCDTVKCNNENHLYIPKDHQKDQTYFLNQVTSEQLDKVLFPLSQLNKAQVREIALKNNLVTAKKKDSTGICFIGERNFKQFLTKYLPAQRGEIRDINGKKVGYHDGLMYYTLGQRKGLGIGGIKGENASRWYVVGKDLSKNTLIVSCGEGEELLTNQLQTESFNFIGSFNQTQFDAMAKFRYRQPLTSVRVVMQNNKASIMFNTPQRAITNGQYAVLYQNNRCLGGGVIQKSW